MRRGWRLAERLWLVERGIGEVRAALVERGTILATRTQRDGELIAGDVVAARLVAAREGVARLDDGRELAVTVPPRVSEGAKLHWRVTRAAIPERDLIKRARAVATDAEPRTRTLAEALAEEGAAPVRMVRVEDGALDDAGWVELTQAAAAGVEAFAGGVLRIEQTAAFVTVDVDGDPARGLALAGAQAAARTLRAWGVGGQMVVDLPASETRADRRAIEAAVEAAAPGHYSAVRAHEGGLLHLIAPRLAPSLIERARFAGVESAALALLRRAQRAGGTSAVTLLASPAEVAWIEARPALPAELARGLGRAVRLQADAARGIGGGDVH